MARLLLDWNWHQLILRAWRWLLWLNVQFQRWSNTSAPVTYHVKPSLSLHRCQHPRLVSLETPYCNTVLWNVWEVSAHLTDLQLLPSAEKQIIFTSCTKKADWFRPGMDSWKCWQLRTRFLNNPTPPQPHRGQTFASISYMWYICLRNRQQIFSFLLPCTSYIRRSQTLASVPPSSCSHMAPRLQTAGWKHQNGE